MDRVWSFLSTPKNQKTISWIGGGLVVVLVAPYLDLCVAARGVLAGRPEDRLRATGRHCGRAQTRVATP